MSFKTWENSVKVKESITKKYVKRLRIFQIDVNGEVIPLSSREGEQAATG